jgi:hypothetical protein
MKTAMQELTDILENYKMSDITDEQKSIFSSIIYQINIIFLEKEKEQIITDYSNGLLYALGYKHQDKNIDYGVTMQSKAEADIYYNQTYNQTNVGNDGFEFDNSSTIPPPKTNNL